MFCPEVNVRINYPIKKALVELDNNQMIDMSYEIQKSCASFVVCAVASHGFKIVMSRNPHTIPGIIYFPKLFLIVTTQYHWVMSNIPINISWRYLNFKVPAGNYMFRVSNRNTRTRCELCSKLTRQILERRHWRRSNIFIVNFEHISHLVLIVFLLLTLSR